MPGNSVVVLVGTHKGGAGRIGEAIADRLVALGEAASWRPMDRIAAADLRRFTAVVVCTSTFGAGGVPPNATDLLAELRSDAVDLAGILVGVVGRGDSSFGATYNGGCRTFAEVLRARGAVIVGPTLLFDAADPTKDPDPEAWAEAWWRSCTALLRPPA